VGNKVLH